MYKDKILDFLKRGRTVSYIITVTVSVILLIIGSFVAGRGAVKLSIDDDRETYVAKVVRVGETIIDENSVDEKGNPATDKYIHFTAKILKGEDKGKTVDAVQIIEGISPIDPTEVYQGRKVILTQNRDYPQAECDFILLQFIRTNTLVFLLIAFFVLLIIFGRMKGFNTIVSLILTVLSVFTVFIPSVLSGMNIYFWSIIVCVYITVMTLLIVQGANKKSFCAGVGCISGVCVAGILFWLADFSMKLSGNTTEDTVYLLYLETPKPIDLKAVIFAAIIIGAVGAIMDVAMSVSSALYEIKENSPDISLMKLFSSGLTIGRDMMGTMANTLVLAYMGSSLSVVLLLFAYEQPLIETLNREMIVVDILQALVGSFGILFTIPLTSFISSALYTNVNIRKKQAHTVKKNENPAQKSPEEIDYNNSLY